jgi:hypothetical protein
MAPHPNLDSIPYSLLMPPLSIKMPCSFSPVSPSSIKTLKCNLNLENFVHKRPKPKYSTVDHMIQIILLNLNIGLISSIIRTFLGFYKSMEFSS